MPANDVEAPPAPKPVEPFKATADAPPHVLKHPLSWLLWFLDDLVWLLSIYYPVMWMVNKCQHRKYGTTTAEGAIRSAGHERELVTVPHPSITTAYEMFKDSTQRFAKNNAFGTRTYLGVHAVEGSKHPLAKFGETHWQTYEEVGQRAAAFGAGLRTLGMTPLPSDHDMEQNDGPFTVVVFEDTSAPWATGMYGAFSQSMVVATCYSTLGIQAVVASVNETAATAILCNVKNVAKVAEVCTLNSCPALKAIIYTSVNSVETTVPTVSTHLKITSFEELITCGHAAIPSTPPTPPKPENMAVIMYTSGSTGKPKGVMITHKSLTASVAGMKTKLIEFGFVGERETYCAYLPAAHIFECVVELTAFAMGCAIGFADPHTISSKGAVRQRPDGTLNTKPEYPYPPGAIQEFRPSVLVAVPKIWDILKKGVEDALGAGSRTKKILFQAAFSARSCALQNGTDTPLFKALVFKKVAGMLGGRLKCGVSGGGPLSAEVQNFIRVAFAMPLLQGYGLTETTCAGTVQPYRDPRSLNIGAPLPSVELKLRSCLNAQGEPEILDRDLRPYLANDKLHYGQPVMGRGEILVRGPSVSSGYFRQPDKTAEVYRNDGWFYTGDVGLFLPDGTVTIVDRVKNLVKLKGGEYIAIESMEKEYSTSSYVNALKGGLMCFGDGEMDRPVALVQANVQELEKYAKGAGITYTSAAELCFNEAVKKAVLNNMVEIGKAANLGRNELLCAIALIPGDGPEVGALTPRSPWTPENEGLTASNKLNRSAVLKGCASILEPLKAAAVF